MPRPGSLFIQRSARVHLTASLCFLIWACLYPAPVVGQASDYEDRLARIRDLTRNSELILVWSEDVGSGTGFVNERIYDLDLGQSDVAQRLTRGPIRTDSVVTEPRSVSVASGNFAGSDVEHFVAAWTGSDAAVTIAVPHVDPEGLDWTSASRLTADGPNGSTAVATLGLASGDFTGDDMRDEFVLGIQGDDGTLQLPVYGFEENGLQPHLVGSVTEEAGRVGLETWDLAAGDFDGDGDEDIAMLFAESGEGADSLVTARIYSVDAGGMVSRGPSASVFPRPEFSTGESVSISTGRAAAGDDWIYANVLDIDYYEYPVYDGDDPTPVGHFIVSIPRDVRPLWIEGKNDALLGNRFRPDHEVGNVLSYRSGSSVDVASPIVVFDEQTIGGTGSSFARLELSTFTESSAATSWESGYEIGATVGLSADIYGIEIGSEIELEGTYSFGEVTTQTVTVEESLEMQADFGRLQNEFGTSATYQIEPYAYWTVYGALAIDYGVAIPSDPSSFWQSRYGGKTDLGFSLPWRYDARKGLSLPNEDPTYAERSRDIVLSVPDPEGGDTVRIGARVRNIGSGRR